MIRGRGTTSISRGARMGYPVAFEMDYVRRRSRLSTFFRYILMWPHLFFAFFYSIAFYVVWTLSWFVLLVTARWPDSLYGFTGGFLRYATRVTAYLYLGVDRYPPFSGADDPNYPVRIRIAPPQNRYSRLKILFRMIYAILALVIRYAMGIVIGFVSFLSWFVIVITGRQPESLQDALNFALSYTTRADALIFLITETYPSLSDSN